MFYKGCELGIYIHYDINKWRTLGSCSDYPGASYEWKWEKPGRGHCHSKVAAWGKVGPGW